MPTGYLSVIVDKPHGERTAVLETVDLLLKRTKSLLLRFSLFLHIDLLKPRRSLQKLIYEW